MSTMAAKWLKAFLFLLFLEQFVFEKDHAGGSFFSLRKEIML